MKIKDGFILRKVGRQYIVAATGSASKDFNGMIRLNASSAFVFELLKNDISRDEIVQKLMAEYDVDPDTAQADVDRFLAAMKEAGAIV